MRQRHERRDGLALDLVCLADHRRLRHRGVFDERRLHLHRRHAVAGDVHDVIDPAEEPEVAVLVTLGAVSGEIETRDLAPVRLPVPLGITVDAAQHPRPWLLQHQIPRLGRLTLLIHDVGFDAGKR